VTNGTEDPRAIGIMNELNLDSGLLIGMFEAIKKKINDPITIDAFYLEMRQSNDPQTKTHAEDYNLMVSDMVQKSQQRLPELPQRPQLS